MRDLNHAQRLIEATVSAASVPVTLKMRLGWDEMQLNAPELAMRAEASGIAMITVHGRTRCQFYKGRADWAAIRLVRETIIIPLIANGDLTNEVEARNMLRASGADGLMMGRGAFGRPWAPAVLAEALDKGSGRAMPSLDEQRMIVLRHNEGMLGHYGLEQGKRVARKHLGWYVEDLKVRGHLTTAEATSWRRQLVECESPLAVRDTVNGLYATLAVACPEAA
jgi:nifR3 family TIM-barrel protein